MKNGAQRRSILAIGAIVAVLLTIGIITQVTNSHKNTPASSKTTTSAQTAKLDLEDKTVNYVKALLNVYYVKYGYYPINFSDLKAIALENNGENTYSSIGDTLNNFDYKYSGDRKSYQITYRSSDGTVKTVSGNYDKEYH